MCLVLLMTPGIVTVASLCLLFQLDLAAALARFPDFGTSQEMMVAAFLTVATGMTVYLGIALATQKKPLLAEILVIGLSQVVSWLAATAALVHNPQEEFCKANAVGSALAKAYQLDSCSLTYEFWMQLGFGGLVVAVFMLLLLSLVRSALHAISR
jgi:hypothetical protein